MDSGTTRSMYVKHHVKNVWKMSYFHTLFTHFSHVFHTLFTCISHTHTHPCILVRTIFPDPSCEDTLFHSSYPNDTGAFISWLLGLLKHLVEIRKWPIFFVGTLLWGHFTLRTLPTCGDCGLDSTYGHTELHTRLVGIASWDSTYGYTWQNTLLVGTSWTVRIGTRQYTQLVLVGQSFAQLERPIW